MARFFVVVIISIIIAPAAIAQNMTYQPQDAALLANCIEEVENQFENSDGTASPRNLSDCIGAAFNSCQNESPQSTTTIGMMECSSRETSWWDKMLNENYSILKDKLEREDFVELRKAQRAWITYRDEKCNFEYFYWREGTIRSIFYSSCQLDMTARRALELDGYLDWLGW